MAWSCREAALLLGLLAVEVVLMVLLMMVQRRRLPLLRLQLQLPLRRRRRLRLWLHQRLRQLLLRVCRAVLLRLPGWGRLPSQHACRRRRGPRRWTRRRHLEHGRVLADGARI